MSSSQQDNERGKNVFKLMLDGRARLDFGQLSVSFRNRFFFVGSISITCLSLLRSRKIFVGRRVVHRTERRSKNCRKKKFLPSPPLIYLAMAM
jgi:hypothetical protein